MSLLDKLIRVERSINIYLDSGNELINEVLIDIDVERLKEVIIPKEDDPELYDGYILNEKQLKILIDKCVLDIVPDFNKYSYILVAGGIYDWDKAKS